MRSQFHLQQQDQYFRFVLRGQHHQPVLLSRLFHSLPHCQQGISELIAMSAIPDRIDRLHDRYGHHSFVIRNERGVQLAHSASFYSASDRDLALYQYQQGLLSGFVVFAPSIKKRPSPGYSS